MADKQKFDRGSKDKAPNVTGAKINSKTGIVAVAYPLKAAATCRVSKPAAKTIEQRLEDKAAIADTKVFVSPSLGQMSRVARRKFLFG